MLRTLYVQSNYRVYQPVALERQEERAGNRRQVALAPSIFSDFFCSLLTPPTSAPRHSRTRQLRRRSDAAGIAKASYLESGSRQLVRNKHIYQYRYGSPS
ncbi:uncharacterized protein TrAtP1_011593 [Trichoderma atroviride]|uniref:uncharacterized protein n=1 Tax=Hypocrea atroviridis TaxID=63577 RepID=UPI0033299003|nr:hypothetical protein TrAtP1_011593 [Trichoderma atroviride]